MIDFNNLYDAILEFEESIKSNRERVLFLKNVSDMAYELSIFELEETIRDWPSMSDAYEAQGYRRPASITDFDSVVLRLLNRILDEKLDV